jgi:hypothetical protein
MGMDLENGVDHIRVSAEFWCRALRLATLYDWKAMGTLDYGPHPASAVGQIWDGNYVTNDYQYVRPTDAKALAAALSEALDDIPDDCVLAEDFIDPFDDLPDQYVLPTGHVERVGGNENGLTPFAVVQRRREATRAENRCFR